MPAGRSLAQHELKLLVVSDTKFSLTDDEPLEILVQSPTAGEPTKPARLHVQFEQSGDRLAFSYRHRGWGPGCFMLVWEIGWTVGCVFLVGLVVREPTWHNFLFAVPFWAAWFFVFAMLLNMFFGRERFSIGPDGAELARWVIMRLSYRTVPLAEIKRFEFCTRVVDSDSGSSEAGLRMQTIGRPLQFCWGLPDEELQWLAFQLNRCLAVLKGESPESAIADAAKEEAKEAAVDDDISAPQEPALEKYPLDPPSDCAWRREEDFQDLVFVRRGRFSFANVFGALFINAFWNGIVAVFVYQLWFGDPKQIEQGFGWWGMFFFLIPFEVIGLVMFVYLLSELFAPFRRTEWRFADAMLHRRTTWFGVGPRRADWLDSLERIELRQVKKRKWIRSSGNDSEEQQGKYGLCLIDRRNTEICTLDGLTEGEARWMYDVIRRRPAWFS
jgi:hypothetical protein